MKTFYNLRSVISFFLFAFSANSMYSQTNQWTWVKGDKTSYTTGVYGTKGVEAAANKPGARRRSVSWTDMSGNLWLFGGTGDFNDLWKYNILTNGWTWVKGDSITDISGVYGIKGVSSAANKPGARGYINVSWTDATGNLWLFGGDGYAASNLGSLNDLWKYNPSINEWTWVKGDSIPDVAGIYGTLGASAAANKPGARRYGMSWKDASGNFWLFGGDGDASRSSGYLNDLWKYNISTNEWTWVKGDSIADASSIYGTRGVSSASTKPGGRESGVTWTDASGNLWLFGGFGYTANSYGYLNDLWKYNPLTNEWTWIKGDSTSNAAGIYGLKGISNPSNKPRAREYSVSWTDANNLWLYGGDSDDPNGNGYLNDVWKYNAIANEWTWVNGDSLSDVLAVHGTLGASSAANTPGGRRFSVSWTDATGNFWLFGGNGLVSGGSGNLNDLWKYTTRLDLCPGGSNTFTSNIKGTSYQWQVNTSSGFVNITDNGNYSGSNTITLQLKNIPSSWYGYQYRCIANGINSDPVPLRFLNNWTGAVNTAWENPANWSCGLVPDNNSDVYINAGSITLNSNRSCRSLNVKPGVIFTVNGNYNLSIIH